MRVVEEIDQFLVGVIAFPAINYALNRKDILGRYRKLLVTEQYSQDALKEPQFQKLSAVPRHQIVHERDSLDSMRAIVVRRERMPKLQLLTALLEEAMAMPDRS
jgi:hypothetical protein